MDVRTKKSKRSHLVISVTVAVLMFTTGAYTQGLPEAEGMREMIGILSNAFLFPAVLLGGIGALSWIASQGTFDMLRYGVSMAITGLLHPRRKFETFYDYKMQKAEKQNGWLVCEFVVGLICLACCLLCIGLYFFPVDNF